MPEAGGELRGLLGEREGRVSGTSAPLDGSPIREVLFSETQIATRVSELAAEIRDHYSPAEDLLVLGLLKGSFIFLADLVRSIQRPLQVDFMVASSYGLGQRSTGEVRLLYDVQGSLHDRNVLLVEDIVDSGQTLEALIPVLLQREPRSLEVCALLRKRSSPASRGPRWVGFDCPDRFVVGYGLDHAENLRHLPFIGSL